MNLEKLECKNCGMALELDNALNGVIHCRNCGMSFILPREKQLSDVLVQLQIGETELDKCEFERAYTAYAKAAEAAAAAGKEEPEAYFGMALAEARIQYLRDMLKNRLQPICHKVGEGLFSEGANYQKALQYASAEQKKIYRARAAEIDDIREKFRALEKSGLDFDTFLCLKVTDDGDGSSQEKKHTEEYFAAEQIFRALEADHYRPFFSEESIAGHAGTDYEAMILYALCRAKCMIVVCFDEKHLRTKWVKNEYTRYIGMMSAGTKAHNSLTIVFRDKPIERLSGISGRLQGIDFSDSFAYKKIHDFVSSFVDQKPTRKGHKKLVIGGAAVLASLLIAGTATALLLPKNEPDAGALEEPAGGGNETEETPGKGDTDTPVVGEVELTFEPLSDGSGYRLIRAVPNGNTAIEIPATYEGAPVTTVAGGAFAACAGVTALSLPEGLTTLDDKALMGCEDLTQLVIPSTVTELGETVLYGCGALQSLTLSFDGQSYPLGGFFGTDRFSGSTPVFQRNENYYVPGNLKSVTVRGSTLPYGAFTGCEMLETVSLSDEILSLPESVFSGCTALDHLDAPEHLEVIGAKAFESCTALTSLSIPASVTEIGDTAFDGCTALTSLTMEGVVAEIGETILNGCTGLTDLSVCFEELTLADYFGSTSYSQLRRVTAVGRSLTDGALESCSAVTRITLPEGITALGDRALWGCSGITELTLPLSVTDLGTEVLGGCTGLTALTMHFTEAKPFGTLFGTVANAASLATVQGNETYYIPATLRQVSVRGSVLASGAFEHCAALTGIRLDQEITALGDRTFAGCEALSTLTWSTKLTAIGAGALSDCTSLTAITVPTGVISVGAGAFSGCTALTRVDWQATACADFTSADKIFVGAGQKGDGIAVIFNPSMDKIPAYLFYVGETTDGAPKLTSVSFAADGVAGLSDSVTGCSAIGENAFYGCSALASVQIPATVTAIGTRAFGLCDEIRRIAIGSMDAWCRIDFADRTANPLYGTNGMLYVNDTGITDLTVPAGLSVLKPYTFIGYTALQSVSLPADLTSIGSYAFYQCVNIGRVSVPDIDMWFALELATSANPFAKGGELYVNGAPLTAVTIPAAVSAVEAGRLSGCTTLRSLTVPATVTSLGAGAFADLVNLTEIVWNTASVTLTANNDIFTNVGCDGEGVAVSFGETVSAIPSYLFGGSKGNKVSTVTVPAAIGSVGTNAFADCLFLTRLDWNATACADFTASPFAGAGRNGMHVTVGENVTALPAYFLSDTTEISRVLSVTFAGENQCSKVGQYAFRGCDALTDIVLPDSVSEIGSYAFSGCTALGKITLSQGLRTIGSYAFDGCSVLDAVVIPDGVTAIGGYAFQNCIGLSKITLPAQLSAVSERLFYGCSALSSLEIPDSVTSIGTFALSGCSSLGSLTVPFLGNSKVGECSADRLLGYFFGTVSFSGATKVTQQYSAVHSYDWYIPTALTAVTVKGGDIPYGAFSNCTNLKTVTVGGSGTAVSDYAFYRCTGLEQVTLSDTVKSIGTAAFMSCTSLDSVKLPASLTALSAQSFQGCSALRTVTFSQVLAALGESAFQNCVSLSEIRLPGTLGTVSANAFNGCTALSSLTLDEGVNTIGENAFYGCTALEAVTLPSTLTASGTAAFYNCSALSGVYISDLGKFAAVTFTDPESNPLYYAHNLSMNGQILTHLDLPADVTAIGPYAFIGCNATALTVPAGVTYVGTQAFYECKSLVEIRWNAVNCADGSTGASVFGYAGHGADGITLSIGAAVQSIPRYLFSGTNSFTNTAPRLTTVIFEEGSVCNRVGEHAFYNCTWIEQVKVSSLEDWCGIHFDDQYSTPVRYAEKLYVGDALLTSAILPERITVVNPYCFAYMTSLTSVTLHDAVTLIKGYAFNECSALTTLHMSNNVTDIGTCAFYSCTKLKDFTVPETLRNVDGDAFYGCSGLTVLRFPAALRQIGSRAFYGCSGLTTVTFEEGVTSIGIAAFYKCGALTAIDIPSTLTSLGDRVFSGCTKLSNIYWNAATCTVGEYAFENAGVDSTDVALVIGKAVQAIPDRIFYDASGSNDTVVVSLTFEEGSICTRIGTEAFYNACNLTELVLPDSVTHIDDSAFIHCSVLKVTLGKNVQSIGVLAFAHCTNLAEINLPDSLTFIGLNAFLGTAFLNGGEAEEDGAVYSGTTLVSVSTSATGVFTVKTGTTAILAGALADCTSITEVVIPDTVKLIGDGAFSGCTGLTAVTLPAGLTSIGERMFYNCTALKEMVIPTGVKSIGKEAFYMCTAMTTVTIPADVTRFDEKAFYNCKELVNIYYLGDLVGWCSLDFAYQGNPLAGRKDWYVAEGYSAPQLYIGGQSVSQTYANLTFPQ
ncbi:MAG: leucine-rich repeat protein, partial [Clostridia bacterium]|nr:leucine-rich repeat protein [Clostridia bacterium]